MALILIFLIILLVLFAIVVVMAGQTPEPPTTADIVIVGAGTAGCVVARRLSERFPTKRIVILERGDNYTGNPVVYNPKNGPVAAYQAPFSQVLTTNFPNVNLSLASMFGGGSSHNFSLAVYGSPIFYNGAWRQALNLSYDELQPYFRRILMKISPLPVSVDVKSRILPILSRGPETWIKSASIFRDLGPLRAKDPFSNIILNSIAATKSVPIVEDYNARQADCTSKIPQVFIDPVTGIRQETFNTYLPESYLRQSKIVIVSHATVTRLTPGEVSWAGPDGRERTIKTRRIILAAGAIYTPFLLLKSGLTNNVGQQMENHYGTTIVCSVEGVEKFSSGPLAFVGYQSPREWQLVSTGDVNPRLVPNPPSGRTTFSFLLWRLNCRSLGTISAAGNTPTVNLNLFTDGDLSDPNSDLSSILAGLQWTYTVIQQIRILYPSIQVLYPPESALIENRPDVLVGYIKNGVSVTDHYCHTCPLGPIVNPTDFSLISHPSISIVDASVFPAISDGNTTFPVLVMAEIAGERVAQ